MAAKMSLDSFDKKILDCLQDDSSMALAEIARRVGLSTTPCWRRINRLQEAGIIRARVALLERKAVNAGVKIAFGTDIGVCPFGRNAREFNFMVQNGMTPMQAIVAGTRTPARILGLDQLGTVAAGKSADFIVLNANPLDNIANTRKINRVYLRGQEVPRAAMAAKWQAKFRQTASAQ